MITNQQMVGVRLKTQASWLAERAHCELMLAMFAKGVEVFQGRSMEPLQTMVVEIRDNQLFVLWVTDDGVRIVELTSCISCLACGAAAAQERLLIHLTILR